MILFIQQTKQIEIKLIKSGFSYFFSDNRRKTICIFLVNNVAARVGTSWECLLLGTFSMTKNQFQGNRTKLRPPSKINIFVTRASLLTLKSGINCQSMLFKE